jgi:imidazolonepropionase-like amidohydrolase
MRYTQTWNAAGAFVRRAHAYGLPTGGHCAHALPTIAAAIDTHEHADGQCGDWEFGLHEDIAQLYRRAGISVVPVIDLHTQAARVARDTMLLHATDVLPFRGGLQAEGTSNAALLARMERRGARARAGAGVLHHAGVRIATGSDAETLPGGVPRELEALVAAGLSPLEALRAATSNAAAVLGLESELGKLEPGFRADLVLLDANPIADIRNVRRIFAVIQDGNVIDRTTLLDSTEAHF